MAYVDGISAEPYELYGEPTLYGINMIEHHGKVWNLTDEGDFTILEDGSIEKGDSIVQRACLRLRTRRGEWIGDPNFGSRLHEIHITKNAGRKVRDYVLEALDPLLSEGSILDVQTEVVSPRSGVLGILITIVLASGEVKPVTLIPRSQ